MEKIASIGQQTQRQQQQQKCWCGCRIEDHYNRKILRWIKADFLPWLFSALSLVFYSNFTHEFISESVNLISSIESNFCHSLMRPYYQRFLLRFLSLSFSLWHMVCKSVLIPLCTKSAYCRNFYRTEISSYVSDK